MKIEIQDLKQGLVKGVEVYIPLSSDVYKETYFEWATSPLIAKMKSNEISIGVLNAYHHVPVFNEIETHIEPEIFCFVSGTALMIFVDLKDGQPDLDSVQIVRIKPGTQIVIAAGKAHFVPVAEKVECVNMIVVSPKVEAPRLSLSTIIQGV